MADVVADSLTLPSFEFRVRRNDASLVAWFLWLLFGGHVDLSMQPNQVALFGFIEQSRYLITY